MRRLAHGFTLVELGVVIGVMAILMSFTVTRMQGFRENAAFERIANDLDGLAKVGVMYMERQGPDTAWIAVTAGNPIMLGLLPPGFMGTNPLNGTPYEIRIANPHVEVRTALPANSQWVTTWNPAVTVTPAGCAIPCIVSLRKRWLPPSSMVPLLMEKRFLYRDCCCDGTCLPCPFPQPAWYCP